MIPADWVSVGVGVIGGLPGGLVTGICAFFGLRTWVARLEEKHKALAERVEEDRELGARENCVPDGTYDLKPPVAS